jgi:DNA (cytosine-5)-methyltransferase 1
MKYLSTFSGIEAATVAWHPLGWEPVGFSEIEPFPCAVLKHHYPQTPNYGDITQFRTWSVEPFQLLVGGSPCQSFSVAGLRKGLADERGNLMLEFGRLAEHYRPTWVVWENVPGVLSSNGGRDFASFLGMLAEFGYGFAYRVLDAQYFGVPQRRRRVFVVGHLGDWRPAAAVLFDPHSLSGHPPPSREKRQGTAGGVKAGIGGGLPDTVGALFACDMKGVGNQYVQPMAFKVRGGCEGGGKGFLGSEDCAFTLSTGVDQHIAQPIPLNTMAMMGRPSDDGRMGSGIGEPGDPAPTLTKGHSHAVAQPMAFDWQSGGDARGLDPKETAQLQRSQTPAVLQPMATDLYNGAIDGEVTHSLRVGNGNAMGGVPSVMASMQVRRLTPVECERLQGFPDGYTAIPWKNKPAEQCPDGPRYKALGNSMAAPVMRWIGERIQAVEDMMKKLKK